jgi:beta-lactamase class A
VHRLSLVILFSTGLLLPALLRAEARPHFDVSYLSSADLAAVRARKKAVARALGPRVAKALRVVQADAGYALVYLRHGDTADVRVTAAAHSRILRRKGLGSARPVASRQWTVVTDDGSRKPQSPKQAKETEAAQVRERHSLDAMVYEHIKQLRREGRLASDERTAWFIYDFSTGEKLVEINTGLKLQAGSLIKPFVALAYLHAVQEGRFAYDDQSRRYLQRMIQHSDNAATNWAMRKLGGPAAVKKSLRKNHPDLLADLELVEYIPSDGRTYRNKASAQDYSRFLLALWKDELPGSAEIKRLMALPKRDRLSTGVALSEGTEVYSKTGSTSHLCGDMGVLLAKGPDGQQYAYTVIGLIEKQHRARNYLRWLRARGDVIREISGLVNRILGKMHGFAATGPAGGAAGPSAPEPPGYPDTRPAEPPYSPDADRVSKALIEELAVPPRAPVLTCESPSRPETRTSEAAALAPNGTCSASPAPRP